MPAQKRSPEDVDDDLQGNDLENHHGEQMHQDEESNRSSSSDSDDEQDETFALVRLSDVRKEVQCPICLGIIRKTRTVMECLHRFCRECIDKSMRMGNNECPACRTHCASRRSLRDDPNYDALITALYPDIDQYEEEELAFHDEEKVRNKQIQASIAETLRRQTEALGKKRKRSQNSYRRRRNYQTDDEDDSNANDDGKDLSSADEVRTKRTRRWRGQPSPSCAGRDGGGDENDMDVSREAGLTSGGLIGTSEILAWGRGGMRSHTRYGSGSSANSKHSRNSRLAKLVDHLRNLDENDKEMDIHLVLVPLNEQKTPSLPQQYLCCRPALSIAQLCEVVARQTSMPADDVEIWAVKELHSQLPSINCQASNSALLDASKDELRLLDLEDTLAGVMSCNPNRGHLILAYRRKVGRGHYDRFDTGHSEENTWSSLL